jgi:hypothetical protein
MVSSLARETGVDKKAGRPHRAAANNHNLLFPAFFALAHLAFINTAIFFLAAGLIVRFLVGLAAGAFPCAAILFATPARILASPSALSFHLALLTGLPSCAAILFATPARIFANA